MKTLNLHFKIILLLSAFLISSKNIYSQWTIAGDLAGVAGPRPVVSVVDGNTAFVAGGTTPTNATYKTTNGGTNWVQLNTSTLRPFWSIYAKDANTVFAGDNGSGGRINFYKTTDSGNNWTLIDSISGTTAFNAGFRGIRFSNSIPSFGIANAEGNNGDVYIYKTRDAGNTWTRTVLPGYPGYGITGGLNVIDSLFYAFGAFAAMTGLPPSIIITTDGGVTWNLRNVNLPSGNNNTVRGLAFKDKLTGIAGSSSSSQFISRTTNGGLNWVSIDVGYNMANSFIGPIMRWVEGTDICYLTVMNLSIGGVLKGVLKSTNGGLNWAPMETSGLGIIYMDTKRIGTNIYGYANSAVPGAFGGNQVLKMIDVIPQQILYGDSIALGNGMVRTFVQVNAAGRRDLIGVSMTEGVLNNLDTIRRLFVLNFPVTPADTLVNHLFFGWNPQGHPPPLGHYLPPHFDFHFVTTSISERESVIPGPDSILAPQYVPPDHFYDPAGAVPRQGTHWGDSTDPVLHGDTLTQSHTYGFYRGKIFFFEPHVSRAHLLTNPHDTSIIKQANYVTRTGYYPTSYYVAHDQSNQTYNIVLQNFIYREIDVPLPVELSSFVSLVNNRNVKLIWTTATETNNSGFEIERSNVKGQTSNEWNKITFIPGSGTTNSPKNYSFTDRNLNSGSYNYRLKQIDYNGNFEYFNLGSEVNIGIPSNFNLAQNYPNPFNPNTVISYQLAISSIATLKVYDALGREVATIVNQIQDAGYYSIDFNGNNFSSGVYFYKLVVDGNTVDTKRMMLLK